MLEPVETRRRAGCARRCRRWTRSRRPAGRAETRRRCPRWSRVRRPGAWPSAGRYSSRGRAELSPARTAGSRELSDMHRHMAVDVGDQQDARRALADLGDAARPARRRSTAAWPLATPSSVPAATTTARTNEPPAWPTTRAEMKLTGALRREVAAGRAASGSRPPACARPFCHCSSRAFSSRSRAFSAWTWTISLMRSVTLMAAAAGPRHRVEDRHEGVDHDACARARPRLSPPCRGPSCRPPLPRSAQGR